MFVSLENSYVEAPTSSVIDSTCKWGSWEIIAIKKVRMMKPHVGITVLIRKKSYLFSPSASQKEGSHQEPKKCWHLDFGLENDFVFTVVMKDHKKQFSLC